MKKSVYFIKSVFLLSLFLLIANVLVGQTLPYKIKNNSIYPDDQVYVAIVGITDGHVWVDATNGQVKPMSMSDNTMQGPVIEGNKGPGDNALYANCFRKLSDIPNNTINIPQIAGCRIMISFQSPLFLYFFGHSGDPSGYAAPNLANATDPNQGIKYELIELTYNQYGLWCNTTRVDFFQYPIGLEVWGGNNFYKKVGELKTLDEIIQLWKNTVPAPFQSCLDEQQKIIHFPSKTNTFPTNYFNQYIDAIWSKYRTDQLVFNSGDAGVWRGKVTGDVFTFNRESDGQVAYIYGKPSQEEVLEGRGNFATGGTFDLIVQAQMCAAITRHALDLNVPSGVTQNFGNTSIYYQTDPFNWYSKFFHNPDISFQNQTYTFCYDDVFDQSATVHTPSPQRIEITLGGFSGQDNGDNSTGVATFYKDCGYEGKAVELPIGNYNLGDLQAKGILNDDISSIKVSDGYKVIAYWDSNFSGASTVFTSNNSCLVNIGWNDQISSLKIEALSSHPSLLIEAEDFIAMSGVETEACSEGGLNVGWIDAGDWMVWDVNIPTTGSYEVSYRVSSPNATGKIQFEKAGGNPVYGSVNVPNTGGWQNWQTIKHTVNLTAGEQQVAIYVPMGGYNINWLQIQSTSALKSASRFEIPSQGSGIKMFPVPAGNELNVEGFDKGSVIEIFNLQGQKVVESLASPLNISSLSSGLYLIRTRVNGEVVQEKFTKK